MNKKAIYASYGIEYNNGKIFAPVFGWIKPLLIDGNAKLGKGIWTFSTLPTTQIYHVVINGMSFDVKGTCPCSCVGCYATKGFYQMKSVVNSLAVKTLLCREYLDFVKKAISAQIKADNIKFLRIHASGDFFSVEYVNMWKEIATENNSVVFWTYTKFEQAEDMFNGFENAHVVPSIIKGRGFNFGTCEHILACYEYLTNMGKRVHICRCGIDKSHTCTACTKRESNKNACADYDFVLFLEHSTNYKAEEDKLYPIVKALVLSQA